MTLDIFEANMDEFKTDEEDCMFFLRANRCRSNDILYFILGIKVSKKERYINKIKKMILDTSTEEARKKNSINNALINPKVMYRPINTDEWFERNFFKGFRGEVKQMIDECSKNEWINKKDTLEIIRYLKKTNPTIVEHISNCFLEDDGEEDKQPSSSEKSANEGKNPPISSTKDKMICFLANYYQEKEAKAMKEKYKVEKQSPSPSYSSILFKEMDEFFSGKTQSPTDKSIRDALKNAQAYHPINDEIFVSLRKTNE